MHKAYRFKNAFCFFIIFCMIAICLFWYTHIHTQNFWFLLPLTSIVLLILVIPRANIKFSRIRLKTFGIATISGILLYILFYMGNKLFSFLFPVHFPLQVQLLYETLQPTTQWSWILLFILIIPAEEMIWRGYVQGFLEEKLYFPFAILIATAIYVLSLFWAISPLLMLAGIFGGIMWGMLYVWSKNIYVPMISHMIFDLCLLILFPLQ